MDKGVVLIAVGIHYVNWAIQLAASIKVNDSSHLISIAVDPDSKFKADKYFYLFHKIIVLKPEQYSDNGIVTGTKMKLYLYDITPYDETLFIDSDNLFLPRKNINDLYSDFNIQNRGSINVKEAGKNPHFLHWDKVEDICKEFDLKSGKMFNLFSEVITFKKSAKVEKLFKEAKEVYKKMRKRGMARFNGGVPDELCFSVACNKVKLYPKVNWLPTYWEHHDKLHLKMGAILYDGYYIYSGGGNILTPEQKEIFNGKNGLVAYYNRHFTIPPVKMEDKRRFNAKRNNA